MGMKLVDFTFRIEKAYNLRLNDGWWYTVDVPQTSLAEETLSRKPTTKHLNEGRDD